MGAASLVTVHHGGRRSPLLRLLATDEADVLVFDLNMSDVQTGLAAVGECLAAYQERLPYVVLSFTWYLDDRVAGLLVEGVQRLRASLPAPSTHFDNLLILCNADDELARLRERLPGHRIALVNNCYSLSEREMRIEAIDKRYGCVHSARPARFKNHQLTQGLTSIVTIAYGAGFQMQMDDFVDIGAYNAGPVLWDIARDEVRRVMNESRCGILLSNVEGSCYSSAEYLACGLPVVSTVSRGGRDAYYDRSNSIIVGNSADEVREGVTLACSRLASGIFDPVAIRRSFIDRQEVHRRTLATALGAMIGVDPGRLHDVLCARIHADSRLPSYINRYVIAIERA